MIKIVLVGLFVCAAASPRWRHHHHPSPFDDSFERYINDNVFDTQRFWDEFSRDLNNQMRQMETMLEGFSRHFPSMVTTEGIEGNNYKIVIPLVGFQENEIIVKARKGVLMIQAVHNVKGEPQNSYLDVRTLPDCVNEGGNWSYENGVLTVILPLVKKVTDTDINTDTTNTDTTSTDTTSTDTKEGTTAAPDHSREETEKPVNSDTNVDIDNDVGRGDIDNKKILTNIPKVEATTYAVDLKGEYEFVPLTGPHY